MNTHWLTLHDVVYQRQQEELERRLRHQYFYSETNWDQSQSATLWMRMRHQTRSWLDRLAVRRQPLKPVQSA